MFPYCVSCKGRLWCNLAKCPILEQHNLKTRSLGDRFRENREEIVVSPPGIFVSRSYPGLRLAGINSLGGLSSPEEWINFPQDRVIEERQEMLSVFVNKKDRRSVLELQEGILSSSKLDVEVVFEKKPRYRLSFSEYEAPTGAYGYAKKYKLVENPRVEKVVEDVVSDIDMKAEEALIDMYQKGVSVYKMAELFSASLLGLKGKRKFVPTRWSITAVDDVLGKKLIDKIKNYKEVENICYFEHSYAGNHFFILLFPGMYCFEQLEAWKPKSFWSFGKLNIISDFEIGRARKNYADNVSGAYYAARLMVLEWLYKRRRRASIVVFREIDESYKIPLGVWLIREAVGKALEKEEIKFSSRDLALRFLEGRLDLPLDEYLKKSEVFKVLKQKKLTDWIC